MYQLHASQFEQIVGAGSALEEQETEYHLKDLVLKSGLSQSEVLLLLKKHWVEADDLDFVYLDLTKEEEEYLSGF